MSRTPQKSSPSFTLERAEKTPLLGDLKRDAVEENNKIKILKLGFCDKNYVKLVLKGIILEYFSLIFLLLTYFRELALAPRQLSR